MDIFAFIGRLFWDIFVPIAIFLFAAVSTVLFIKDGICAKREGRGRKKILTVMFILSMAIIALVIVIVVMLSILSMLVMRSM